MDTGTDGYNNMDDPGYRDAVESYRRVVNQTYVKRKEGTETRLRAE